MIEEKIARIERDQNAGGVHADGLGVDQMSVSALAIEAAHFLRSMFQNLSANVSVLVSQPGCDLNAQDSDVVVAIREHCTVTVIWVIAGLRQKCATVQAESAHTEHGKIPNPKVVTAQLLLLGQVCWAMANDDVLFSLLSIGVKTPAPSEAEMRAAFKTVDSTGRGEIGARQVVEAQVGDNDIYVNFVRVFVCLNIFICSQQYTQAFRPLQLTLRNWQP